MIPVTTIKGHRLSVKRAAINPIHATDLTDFQVIRPVVWIATAMAWICWTIFRVWPTGKFLAEIRKRHQGSCCWKKGTVYVCFFFKLLFHCFA